MSPMKKPIDAPLSDRRFAASEWQQWPYRAMAQSFLAQQQWWQEATTGIKGLSSHQTQLLSFSVRQVLDMLSPSNFLWSNPEAQHVTVKTGGANLLQGLRNRHEDALRVLSGGPAVWHHDSATLSMAKGLSASSKMAVGAEYKVKRNISLALNLDGYGKVSENVKASATKHGMHYSF